MNLKLFMDKITIILRSALGNCRKSQCLITWMQISVIKKKALDVLILIYCIQCGKMLVNIQYNLTDITVPLPNTTISNYGMSQDMVLMLTYSEESPIFQMCFTYMSSTACETPHG